MSQGENSKFSAGRRSRKWFAVAECTVATCGGPGGDPVESFELSLKPAGASEEFFFNTSFIEIQFI